MTTVNYNRCECTEAEYGRVKRPLWTKLAYNSRRLYRCSNCSALLLVQPDDIEDALQRQRASRSFPIPRGGHGAEAQTA